MAIAFTPGQTLVRGDLDIFLTNSAGNPSNAADISYALYWVDTTGPVEVEVLIGPANRIPMNPAVGEYYASLMVPTGATPGTYRIRWTFRETTVMPYQQVVQEFAIVATGSVLAPTIYSAGEQAMIDSLRIFLRDQCVGEEETVELNVAGEKMVVRMDDLWETLNGLYTPGQ